MTASTHVTGLRYTAGNRRDQTDFFVTCGVGSWFLPIRFLAPPEIALLTLNPRKD